MSLSFATSYNEFTKTKRKPRTSQEGGPRIPPCHHDADDDPAQSDAELVRGGMVWVGAAAREPGVGVETSHDYKETSVQNALRRGGVMSGRPCSPGRVRQTPGGVGRNIAEGLCRISPPGTAPPLLVRAHKPHSNSIHHNTTVHHIVYRSSPRCPT
jgi:hypothetical protein